jgi:hypothetical protein
MALSAATKDPWPSFGINSGDLPLEPSLRALLAHPDCSNRSFLCLFVLALSSA